VLLVDGDADAREELVTYLSHAGFRVLEAEHGDEVADLLARERPSLALLDLATPGIDGLDFCRALAEDARAHEVALVAVGDGDDGAEARAVEAGCAGFLARPASHAAAVRVILGALAHASQRSARDHTPD